MTSFLLTQDSSTTTTTTTLSSRSSVKTSTEDEADHKERKHLSVTVRERETKKDKEMDILTGRTRDSQVVTARQNLMRKEGKKWGGERKVERRKLGKKEEN